MFCEQQHSERLPEKAGDVDDEKAVFSSTRRVEYDLSVRPLSTERSNMSRLASNSTIPSAAAVAAFSFARLMAQR